MEAGLQGDRLTRTAAAPAPGIVHLGLGAFFRSHGAIYIAEAMAASGGDWGIIGVSLQSPGTRDAMRPQGWAYTAVEQSPEGEKPRIINVLSDVLVAPENPEAVLEAMADPAIRIVTLTVTEKGYCHNPATGALNPDHPDIAHDLTHDLPRSAPGYLVCALQRRRDAGLAPFTVLSCDNLPHNGALVRGVVLDLARRIDPELADWIETKGRFPASMVDRIAPATSEGDIARIAALTGRHDAAPVMHEPFRQWVIEDDFVGGLRPDLAAVGVQMVADVIPFEHMKLRMLNGTHSALAYLGYLAGHETIAETMADPVFADYVRGLWTGEIIPALTPPEGADLHDYADALAARYANPGIRHRTWQIAMDGSQKLPQRILGTLSENLAAGRASPGLITALAGWMIYVGGVSLDGQPIEVKDPMAAELRAISDAHEGEEVARALLKVDAIFPQDLAARIEDDVVAAYRGLCRDGVRAVLARLG
ncbi:MAG: mannitol dehydrogenase family protein [Paracoccus sp. (in: a-proteobacteria)]|nr:mannitol dehydrogenase family protein [Paracoccus sp. (in: a-proteobacteria)]